MINNNIIEEYEDTIFYDLDFNLCVTIKNYDKYHKAFNCSVSPIRWRDNFEYTVIEEEQFNMLMHLGDIYELEKRCNLDF